MTVEHKVIENEVLAESDFFSDLISKIPYELRIRVRLRVDEILAINKATFLGRYKGRIRYAATIKSSAEDLQVEELARILVQARSNLYTCLRQDGGDLPLLIPGAVRTIEELRAVMFTRGQFFNVPFRILTAWESHLLACAIDQHKAAGRLVVDNCDTTDAYEIIRHNHKTGTKEKTPEQRRLATIAITRSLAKNLVMKESLDPETTVVILPWRTALVFGAAMAELGFKRFIHIGASRDEHTLQTKLYFNENTEQVRPGDTVVCMDPMLATGATDGEGVKVAGINPGRTNRKLIFQAMIAAPEGVDRLLYQYPQSKVYTGALDAGLNEKGFIEEDGAGDLGDQFYEDFPKSDADKWTVIQLLPVGPIRSAFDKRMGWLK